MDSPAAGEKEGEIWNQERGQGRLVDRDFVGRGYCDLVLIARSTGDSYGKPNLLSHDTDPKKDAAFSFCELINSEKERRVRQGSDIFLSFTCVSHLVLYGWFFGDGVTDRSIVSSAVSRGVGAARAVRQTVSAEESMVLIDSTQLNGVFVGKPKVSDLPPWPVSMRRYFFVISFLATPMIRFHSESEADGPHVRAMRRSAREQSGGNTMEDAAEKEFELCPGEEQDSDIPKIAETGEVTKSRTKQDAEQMAIELLSARFGLKHL
ncbi:hypothetical protein GW17_00001659 [Ensete ventricosum]|nr:hypothetical protein GW17_00001659 [Ensete ventricosum]